MLVGALPYALFDAKLKELLAEIGVRPAPHHTRQTGCFTIFEVAGQLNAFANSGMFETTPFVRY